MEVYEVVLRGLLHAHTLFRAHKRNNNIEGKQRWFRAEQSGRNALLEYHAIQSGPPLESCTEKSRLYTTEIWYTYMTSTHLQLGLRSLRNLLLMLNLQLPSQNLPRLALGIASVNFTPPLKRLWLATLLASQSTISFSSCGPACTPCFGTR